MLPVHDHLLRTAAATLTNALVAAAAAAGMGAAGPAGRGTSFGLNGIAG